MRKLELTTSLSLETDVMGRVTPRSSPLTSAKSLRECESYATAYVRMLQLYSSSLQPLVVVFSTPNCRPSPKTLKKSRDFSVFSCKTRSYAGIRYELDTSFVVSEQSEKKSDVSVVSDSFNGCRICSCGRRHLFGSLGASLLPVFHSKASDLESESKAMLNKIHPARPDWYEELYALALDKSMKAYEKEIAGYKAELFGSLRGKSKEVLELGIGTGPNLKYYAGDAGVRVFGVDPNTKMEKYAQAAAISVGLPLNRFYFTQAVGEALPVSDASMDAVIGTLVLCSVKDVKMTLKEVKRVLKPGGLYLFIEHVGAKDGTTLLFVQRVVDPLQQIVSDGCHLTRETGKFISEAGFSDVRLNSVSLSTATLISPHVYGIAYK